jgi:hypothetical protein
MIPERSYCVAMTVMPKFKEEEYILEEECYTLFASALFILMQEMRI